jgi:hypothetical protein
LIAEPKDGAQILSPLHNRQSVKIINEQTGFYQIEVENLTGWIWHNHVLVLMSVKPLTGYINTDGISSLKKPEYPGELVHQYSKGDKVQILERRGKFWRINIDEWVFPQFVTLEKENSKKKA